MGLNKLLGMHGDLVEDLRRRKNVLEAQRVFLRDHRALEARVRKGDIDLTEAARLLGIAPPQEGPSGSKDFLTAAAKKYGLGRTDGSVSTTARFSALYGIILSQNDPIHHRGTDPEGHTIKFAVGALYHHVTGDEIPWLLPDTTKEELHRTVYAILMDDPHTPTERVIPGCFS